MLYRSVLAGLALSGAVSAAPTLAIRDNDTFLNITYSSPVNK